MRAIVTASVFAVLAPATVIGQSDYQKALFQRTAQTAETAAAAARPVLLEALDAADFRTELQKCCPDVANATSQELLDLLVSETQALEIISGIPAGEGSRGEWDTTLEDAAKRPVLDCEWANHILHHEWFPAPGEGGWIDIQDDVETTFYGLKPFSKPAVPASVDEANERISYFLLNSVRFDGGSPLYGNVSLVLDNAAVKDAMLISAIDTGEWAAQCNHSGGLRPIQIRGYEHNCAGYNHTLGTLDNLEHLFLGNANYWNLTTVSQQLARRLQLLLYPWQSPLKGWELTRYMEAAPILPLAFNSTVRFIIGSFPAYFGSDTGDLLRNFTDTWNIPLVWSLSLNIGYGVDYWSAVYIDEPLKSNTRLLDVSHAHANASGLADGLAPFQEAWTQAQQLRQSGHAGAPDWFQLWQNLSSAVPDGVHLTPLRASSCEDLSLCIGLSGDGECVCRTSNTTR